jgi:hypothetical protein
MMKDIHGKPLPVVLRPGPPAKSPEPARRGIEQRHWVKLFIAGLFLTTYGSLEFMAGKPQISNIFNDPLFAGYWVMAGMFTLFTGLLVRTWGSR